MESYSNYNLMINEFNEESKEDGIVAVLFMVMNAVFNEPGFVPNFPDVGFALDSLKHTLISDKAKLATFKNNVTLFLRKIFPELKFEFGVSLVKSNETGEIMTNVTITESSLGLVLNASANNLQSVSYNVTVKNYNN